MCCCLVTKPCKILCDPMDCNAPGFTCPSPYPRVYSNSYPLSQWYHTTISFSIVPFSSWPQSFPASGSFPVSQFFASGGQICTRWSFSISPSNEYSGLISFKINWFDLLAVQGTLRVFSSTTVQKHQFFSAQLSLYSKSRIHTCLLEKTIALTRQTFVGKVMSLLLNMLSMLVITLIPGSKRLLIS